MSGNKKQYKQFPIDTIENGMIVLGSLLSNVIVNIDRYKKYYFEACSLFEKYETHIKAGEREVLIPADEYDEVNDKLLYRQREILKYLADYQDSSFSYIDIRKKFVKRGYLKSDLDTSLTELLNEFLDVRNWTFHNPQSLLVAVMENAQRKIPDKLKGIATIQPQLNPVLVTRITHYELLSLMSLIIHAEKRIKQFDLVLDAMKKDYSEMYKSLQSIPCVLVGKKFSEEVEYLDEPFVSRMFDESSEATQLSMGIQKAKYDGSEKAFEEWTLGDFKEILDKKQQES